MEINREREIAALPENGSVSKTKEFPYIEVIPSLASLWLQGIVCIVKYTVWWCCHSEVIECMDKEKQGSSMATQWQLIPSTLPLPTPVQYHVLAGVINIVKHCNLSPVYCYIILAMAPSFALPFLLSLSLCLSLYLSISL